VNDERDRETSWQDPIVAKVRTARAALLASVGYDLEKLAERLRQEQAVSGRRVVTFPPRAPESAAGEAA